MPGAWLTWVTLGCSCLAGIDGIIHSLAPECHQRAGHTKAPPRWQAHSQATCLPMQQLLFSLAGRQRMLWTGRSHEQYVSPTPCPQVQPLVLRATLSSMTLPTSCARGHLYLSRASVLRFCKNVQRLHKAHLLLLSVSKTLIY